MSRSVIAEPPIGDKASSKIPSNGSPKRNQLIAKKAIGLRGTITASPSKSYTHRAIVIGSMNHESLVINPLMSDDTRATISAWKKLGARIDFGTQRPDGLRILRIKGFNGKPSPTDNNIDVGESGTLLRFILPIACLATQNIMFKGKGTLVDRPNAVVDIIRKLGVTVEGDKLPLTICGNGKLKGREISLEGDVTSQVISALLIAAPLAEEEVVIKVEGKLVSKPYIDITIDVLAEAGISVTNNNQEYVVKADQKYESLNNYRIHGDYSSAAFIMAAACLTDSDVTIKDLIQDKQGDREIIDILRHMGADIEHKDNCVRIKGPADLKSIGEISAIDIPDLVPILATLAAFAKGKTTIYDIEHLMHKESDRRSSIANELRKLGVNVTSSDDKMIIEGPTNISIQERVDSHSDHRIAMSLAVLGLCAGNVEITNGHCYTKSYPNFVKHLNDLGASLLEV